MVAYIVTYEFITHNLSQRNTSKSFIYWVCVLEGDVVILWQYENLEKEPRKRIFPSIFPCKFWVSVWKDTKHILYLPWSKYLHKQVRKPWKRGVVYYKACRNSTRGCQPFIYHLSHFYYTNCTHYCKNITNSIIIY